MKTCKAFQYTLQTLYRPLKLHHIFIFVLSRIAFGVPFKTRMLTVYLRRLFILHGVEVWFKETALVTQNTGLSCLDFEDSKNKLCLRMIRGSFSAPHSASANLEQTAVYLVLMMFMCTLRHYNAPATYVGQCAHLEAGLTIRVVKECCNGFTSLENLYFLKKTYNYGQMLSFSY